jgi:hypothetical protein
MLVLVLVCGVGDLLEKGNEFVKFILDIVKAVGLIPCDLKDLVEFIVERNTVAGGKFPFQSGLPVVETLVFKLTLLYAKTVSPSDYVPFLSLKGCHGSGVGFKEIFEILFVNGWLGHWFVGLVSG